MFPLVLPQPVSPCTTVPISPFPCGFLVDGLSTFLLGSSLFYISSNIPWSAFQTELISDTPVKLSAPEFSNQERYNSADFNQVLPDWSDCKIFQCRGAWGVRLRTYGVIRLDHNVKQNAIGLCFSVCSLSTKLCEVWIFFYAVYYYYYY